LVIGLTIALPLGYISEYDSEMVGIEPTIHGLNDNPNLTTSYDYKYHALYFLFSRSQNLGWL